MRNSSLRVNSGMLNVIRIVTSYTLPPVRVARLFRDCNGVFAINAYVMASGTSSLRKHSTVVRYYRSPETPRINFEKQITLRCYCYLNTQSIVSYWNAKQLHGWNDIEAIGIAPRLVVQCATVYDLVNH